MITSGVGTNSVQRSVFANDDFVSHVDVEARSPIETIGYLATLLDGVDQLEDVLEGVGGPDDIVAGVGDGVAPVRVVELARFLDRIEAVFVVTRSQTELVPSH